MRWYSESFSTKYERLKNWHKWFAWHPVRVKDEIVWLEKVERKKVYVWEYSHWEYK